MTTEQVWTFIEEIDHQIVSCVKNKFDIEQVRPLIELRNNVLLKYQPSSDINWRITNKQVLAFLKKQNWHVQWIARRAN